MLLVVGLGGIAAETRADSQLPPVGQRWYLPAVEREGSDTVQIWPDDIKPVTAGTMRDPTLVTTEKAENTASKPAKPDSKPRAQALSTTKLRFSRLAVTGQHTTPRVQFKQERLSASRADQSLSLDFLDRLLDSARPNSPASPDSTP